jgi:hypothetical protein
MLQPDELYSHILVDEIPAGEIAFTGADKIRWQDITTPEDRNGALISYDSEEPFIAACITMKIRDE